ncbi:MAG: sugar phosphate isomerase/epimerase [Planctomycetota bacterium]
MNPTSASQDVRRSASLASQVKLLHGEQTTTSHLTTIVPATKIRLSLSQLTTMRWSLEDEVLQLKALGYDGIGLWRPKVSESGEGAAAEVIRKADVGVASLSFAGGFTGRNSFSFRDAMADARDAICEAELLGAENLIVVGGARNHHTIRHSRRLVTEALRELSEFAMLHGVRLSLLPMHSFFAPTWTYLHTLDETLELLDNVNHPSVGLAFDTYHLWREPRLLERIPELVPLTGVVQVSDSRRAPQTDSDRCFPGEGRIPLNDIVRAFQQAGYDGYFDVQVWSDEGWAKTSVEMVRLCQSSAVQLAQPTGSPLSSLPVGE